MLVSFSFLKMRIIVIKREANMRGTDNTVFTRASAVDYFWERIGKVPPFA
jgi:hypothetical protein